MQIEQLISQYGWLFYLSLATMPLKGVALWQSARLSQKWWFIIIFISSTLGILDLFYILFVARRYKVVSSESVN